LICIGCSTIVRAGQDRLVNPQTLSAPLSRKPGSTLSRRVRRLTSPSLRG